MWTLGFICVVAVITRFYCLWQKLLFVSESHLHDTVGLLYFAVVEKLTRICYISVFHFRLTPNFLLPKTCYARILLLSD